MEPYWDKGHINSMRLFGKSFFALANYLFILSVIKMNEFFAISVYLRIKIDNVY